MQIQALQSPDFMLQPALAKCCMPGHCRLYQVRPCSAQATTVHGWCCTDVVPSLESTNGAVTL